MIFFYIYLTSDGHANTIMRDNLVPRTLEMAFQSFQISKFSGGACPQTPLGHTVGYSSLTSCLLQILLKPLSSSKTKPILSSFHLFSCTLHWPFAFNLLN